jgi:hypothetical protein
MRHERKNMSQNNELSDDYRIQKPMVIRRSARIISDETYPDMHRVRWPDGKLSDMANLSRAHDTAARFNESLEREFRGRQRPSEVPYVRLNLGRAAW